MWNPGLSGWVQIFFWKSSLEGKQTHSSLQINSSTRSFLIMFKRSKSRPFNNSASRPIVSDQQINRPCIEHKSPADYRREEGENFVGNEIPNWRLFQLNQCVYKILQLWLQGKSYFQIDAALECSRHKSNSKNDVQAICCHYINHAINFRGWNSVQSDLIAWLLYTKKWSRTGAIISSQCLRPIDLTWLARWKRMQNWSFCASQ